MDEHVHVWRFGYLSGGNYNLPSASTPGFYCTHKDCGYDSRTWLSLAEAEARLNATGRLSAEDAMHAEAHLAASLVFELADKMKDYADILESPCR